MPVKAGTLCLAIALSTTSLRLAAATLQTKPSDLVADFDRSVAQGFPARLSIGATDPRSRRDVNDTAHQLVVESGIPANVTFADGTRSRMYQGTFDDKPVAMTRSGSRLDISLPRSDGMHVISFSTGIAMAERRHITDTGVAEADWTTPQRQRRQTHMDSDKNSRAVKIHMFIHDDIQGYMTQEQVHAGYVAWWLRDANRVTLPFVSIDVIYHAPIHGVTNMPYIHPMALSDWTRTVKRWADEEDETHSETHLKKFILITLLQPQTGVTGIAWQGGNFAMASIAGRYRIVAHELGHLFGALHENAAIQYKSGWWCESNMYPNASALRSNCYTYSDDNRRRMRAYIVESPLSPDMAEGGPPVID